MHQTNSSNVRFRAALAAGALTLGFLSLASPARGNLVIVPAFDSSVTNDPNAALIEAGINSAIGRLQNAVLNPVTVHITFFTTNQGLGGSSTNLGEAAYSDYLDALTNNQIRSANDNKAIASLPVTTNNPVNGTPDIVATLPLFRALGFDGADIDEDGEIFLNTSIMNLSRTGTQNPNFYDLQSVVAHEMDEVLDVGGPGSELGSGGFIGPEDLFRYSAPNTRSFTTDVNANAYFSIDGGATNIIGFNSGAGGSDYADWANNAAHHVQDAFGTPGTQRDIDTPELTALDVVGWDLAPEPASIGLIALAAFGLTGRRRAGAAK